MISTKGSQPWLLDGHLLVISHWPLFCLMVSILIDLGMMMRTRLFDVPSGGHRRATGLVQRLVVKISSGRRLKETTLWKL
eukprot:s354_g20.t1